MACRIINNSTLLLGRCVPCLKKKTSKFLIKTLEFDSRISMYFKRNDYIFAHDPVKTCKPGDVVLVKKLPEKMSALVTHEVLEVVYQYGDITDPVTGKKVMGEYYRDQLKEEISLYGELETSFKYENAPPRGWQADKRDFSDRESYTKYHIFDNDNQPDAV